nr:DUF6350 family protein [Candidatus Nanopelagicales bacterium]
MPVRPAAARPEEPVAVDDPSAAAPHDPPAAPASRRPLVAGAIAGAWSLLVGIAVVTCLVMLTWAVSPWSAGDAAAAWRAAGLTWLGAHQVPLQVGGDPLTLLPLGGLLLGLLLARRAGAWAGRLLPDPSPAEVARVAVGAALLYGAGGAAIAWLSAAEGAYAVPARAALGSGLVAVVGVLWGIGPEAGLLARAHQRVGDAVWRTLAAGLAAVLGLLAVGALLVAVSLVRHFADAGAALGALEAGVLGSAGLTLLDLLALPSLAVWAMAVVVGPGVRLGALGELSAFGGEVGSLPALPVLAAIPTSLPGWAPALLLVPVLLGVLAGRIRWGRDLPTPLGALTGALAVGAVVGGLLVVLAGAASGSLGAGRLGELGPPVWPVAAAGAGLVVLGFLLEAGGQLVRLSWELHRAEQRAAEQRAAEQPVAPAPDGVGLGDPVEPVLAAPGPEPAVVVAGQPAGPGRAGRLAGRAGAALGPAALGVRG